MTGRGQRELQELELVFKALAHRARRQVLVVLNARGGQMSAGEIAKRFSHAWPTTSRHLRILERAGLVRVEKRGREWVYHVNSDRLHEVVGKWLRWLEPGPADRGEVRASEATTREPEPEPEPERPPQPQQKE